MRPYWLQVLNGVVAGYKWKVGEQTVAVADTGEVGFEILVNGEPMIGGVDDLTLKFFVDHATEHDAIAASAYIALKPRRRK